MNVIKALELVRDVKTPHDEFIFALEYLAMYREGEFAVHYCDILGDYIYIELQAKVVNYLELLAGNY